MANPRIAGRRGQVVNLDTVFYHNGVPTDPFAIRSVEIYKTQVLPHNLVAVVPFPDPGDHLYPAPAVHTGDGGFVLPYHVPDSLEVPDIFFDVWYHFPTDPCTAGTGTAGCDLSDPGLQAQLVACCHRFWLYPDGWSCFDSLQTLNFGFEPLNLRFTIPEVRPLEIGFMPLPLYDFNVNVVAPILPLLQATINVETRYNELLVRDEAMTVGLRQGSFRTNPFVLRWLVDTSRFLVGTYKYRVLLYLPDGTTRSSPSFNIVINR